MMGTFRLFSTIKKIYFKIIRINNRNDIILFVIISQIDRQLMNKTTSIQMRSTLSITYEQLLVYCHEATYQTINPYRESIQLPYVDLKLRRRFRRRLLSAERSKLTQ